MPKPAGTPFTIDYRPTVGTEYYDPADAGGAVSSLALYTTVARTGAPAASVGPAVKVSFALYRFSVPALAAGTYYAVVTWTPSTGATPVVDTNDTVLVESLGGSFPTDAPVSGPCSPWITGADLPPGCVADLPVGIDSDDLATAAWQILFPLSGRRFCAALTTVLPEVIAAECGCSPAGCACSAYEVVLAGPATSIGQVIVDGMLVPSSAYELRDGRRLVRVDGKAWPCCANRGGSARNFTITYTRGEAPTELAVLAAVEMACELAKSVKDDSECHLPRAVQSMTRQNLTISFNPRDVFADGLTGLPVCDLFIASANPTRKQRPGATIAYPGMPALSTGVEPTPILDTYGGY